MCYWIGHLRTIHQYASVCVVSLYYAIVDWLFFKSTIPFDWHDYRLWLVISFYFDDKTALFLCLHGFATVFFSVSLQLSISNCPSSSTMVGARCCDHNCFNNCKRIKIKSHRSNGFTFSSNQIFRCETPKLQVVQISLQIRGKIVFRLK